MSRSKECHDTEKQNASPAAARVKTWIAAGLAFFVFSGTIAACGDSSPKSAKAVPIKAMSAVFYEKSDELPKLPKPPTFPHVTITPPALPAPPTPPAPLAPTWTPPPRPTAPRTPQAPQPPEPTYTHSAPSMAMPHDAVQAYAKSLVGSSYEFTCMAHIVDRESGWNPQAVNWSGAYGVPQSLPGEKMSSAGADWRTNPKTQLRWMVGYLKSRYGSACNAWSFWQSHGWY